jgi:hypothetical protein
MDSPGFEPGASSLRRKRSAADLRARIHWLPVVALEACVSGPEEVQATSEQSEEEPGEVGDECHPRSARGQRDSRGKDGKHQYLGRTAHGDEPEEAVTEPVRGEDVPDEGEDGTAGAEDGRRLAHADRAERGIQEDLRNASNRPGRHEKEVIPEATGGSFECEANEGERNRVRGKVGQPRVGINARDDGPRPDVDRWGEDEQ